MKNITMIYNDYLIYEKLGESWFVGYNKTNGTLYSRVTKQKINEVIKEAIKKGSNWKYE